MGKDSRIGWCHHTFSPVRACRYAVLADGTVSPACSDGTDKPKCYAEAMSRRNPAVLGTWGPDGVRTFAADAYWRLPIAWNRAAMKAGIRARVFCSSLADIFEGADVDGVESREAIRPDYLPMLDRLFGLIEATPALDWLLLTKRPWNMAAYHRARIAAGKAWPRNIWPGTTTENQAVADERIPHLLRVPGVRFLSVEPMLGPVDLGAYMSPPDPGYAWDCLCDDIDPTDIPCPACESGGGIRWVICGTESDGPRPGKRPTDIEWIRSLRDQAVRAGAAFFLKQMNVGGKLVHAPELDGRTWEEVPNV